MLASNFVVHRNAADLSCLLTKRWAEAVQLVVTVRPGLNFQRRPSTPSDIAVSQAAAALPCLATPRRAEAARPLVTVRPGLNFQLCPRTPKDVSASCSTVSAAWPDGTDFNNQPSRCAALNNTSGIRLEARGSTRRAGTTTGTSGAAENALAFEQRHAGDMAVLRDLTLELSRSWRHWAAEGQLPQALERPNAGASRLERIVRRQRSRLRYLSEAKGFDAPGI